MASQQQPPADGTGQTAVHLPGSSPQGGPWQVRLRSRPGAEGGQKPGHQLEVASHHVNVEASLSPAAVHTAPGGKGWYLWSDVQTRRTNSTGGRGPGHQGEKTALSHSLGHSCPRRSSTLGGGGRGHRATSPHTCALRNTPEDYLGPSPHLPAGTLLVPGTPGAAQQAGPHGQPSSHLGASLC